MAYYGPIQFSPLRAIWQTIFFPGIVCLLLGLSYYLFYDASSLISGLRQAFEKMGQFYREFPYPALALHSLLFLKGLLYRPRIGSFPMQILMICLGLSGVWFLATKVGLHPEQVLSRATTSFPYISTGTSAPEPHDLPTPAPNPLIVHPVKPNLLNQPPSVVRPSVDFLPANDGSWIASGHIASTPVIYVLSMYSSLTAASLELSKYAKKPCIESTSTLDGDSVTGCMAWVEDSYVGPVQLPRMQVFFTPTIPANRIILGTNVHANLSILRTPSDAFHMTRK